MHYKTILLELLQQHPVLHERLRCSGRLLEAIDHYAAELKTSHELWMRHLEQTKPGSELSQLASEAMEIAMQDLQEDLRKQLRPSDSMTEPLSLDGAMAFLRRHTPTE